MTYVVNKGYDSEQAVEGAFRIAKSDGYFWFSDDRVNQLIISADLVQTIEWVES